MASKNAEDLKNFDWDDSALIKAYNKGTKLREKGLLKTKSSKKASKENANDEEQWKVGDYCRAEYSVDKKMYEAKIRRIKDDICVVEFVGYGNEETQHIDDIRDSFGKKARKRQNKEALGGGEYSSASESTYKSTDGETESHRSMGPSKHLHEHLGNDGPFNVPAADNSFHPPHVPHAPVNHLHAASCYAPQTATNLPFLHTPPAPPMPHCPAISQNPSLSAMLISWYMAGYYTGLHEGQKGSQCSQRCCSRANRCCH